MKIITFLLLLSLVARETTQALSQSFVIDGIKYYFSDPVKKNWYQALRFCYEQGLYLLDLETPEENTKVLKYLREQTNEIPKRTYWIAGTSLGNNGEFYWVTTGSRIKYNGFAPNQPDNNSNTEFCLEFNHRKGYNLDWNDAMCDYPNYFICRQTRYFKLEAKT